MKANSAIVLGAGTVVFSAFLLAWLIPNAVVSPRNVSNIVLSPLFWPQIVAVILGIGGAGLLAVHLTGRARATSEDMEEAPPLPPSLSGELRVLVSAALMFGYFWLVSAIGIVFASMLAYAAFAVLAVRAVSSRGEVIAVLITAFLLPLLLYAFFGHVAGVSLPQAPFFRLP
ncbi:MAG: tripartite tricarboxylate transporter TctB family protein [Pseudomonadota bacterium]